MKISVVIPAFNEQRAIGPLLAQLRELVAICPHEIDIIVVDDGSTDQTAEFATSLADQVIRRKSRGGSGTARIDGILASRADYIAMLDADGSYAPKDLLKLFEFVPEFDQVNGARCCESGTWPLLRAPVKWAIRKLAEWVSGHTIDDLNTGMKVLNRAIVLRYLWALSPGFSCVSSMTLAYLCNGHSVKYVPIDYHPRIGTSKFHPIRDTARYLLTVVRVIMYFNPLRVFGPLALALFVAGHYRIFAFGINSPAGIADADVIIIVSSIIILAIGMLADLIVKQRRYVRLDDNSAASTTDRSF
ncbi:glycosyltransferase family 2 protein [Rubinisphaera margarita]|uniref:glycosyltransferase family 2 protein n=1 Tax=Rubinisphaera margarita TaxID=2909586 RepID=UPI001EE902C5|nr:glycosyltransferase family 2 protein [Rubinisphaera margarita]MCG6157250.1 glycosyltransferase family 2 protein [Rubinisphaera margarita]